MESSLSLTPRAFLAQPEVRGWGLRAAGPPWRTEANQFLPVTFRGQEAVLKLVRADDDEMGAPALLRYYAGAAAVRLLASRGRAQVLERVRPGISLQASGDREAAQVGAAVLEQLHAPRGRRPPGLIPLARRFASLLAFPELAEGARLAETLLAEPREECVLHGDMHHANVLLDRRRGWLAIDPKGLWGERTYDYANWLVNPPERALVEGRLEWQLDLLAGLARLEKPRLAAYGAAHACLSAAWCYAEGSGWERARAVADRALEVWRSLAATGSHSAWRH